MHKSFSLLTFFPLVVFEVLFSFLSFYRFKINWSSSYCWRVFAFVCAQQKELPFPSIFCHRENEICWSKQNMNWDEMKWNDRSISFSWLWGVCELSGWQYFSRPQCHHHRRHHRYNIMGNKQNMRRKKWTQNIPNILEYTSSTTLILYS